MMPFDRTEPPGGWDDGLPVWPDEVLRRWWRCRAAELPWRDMPADDAFGYMRRILSELLNEARDIDHESRQCRLRIAARAHGAFRREQLCGLTDLACELEAVVAVVNTALCDSGQAESTTRDSVVDSPQGSSWLRRRPSKAGIALPCPRTGKSLMIFIGSSTGSSSGFGDPGRYGAPAECLRLFAAAVGVSLLVGCSVVRLPSKRVDALIARYGARPAQAFDAGSWVRGQAADGFAVQAAEFGVDWQQRVAGFVGRSRVPGPELQRLVLVTSDSAVMKHVVEHVKSMFDQAPLEACASLSDGRRIAPRSGARISRRRCHQNDGAEHERRDAKELGRTSYIGSACRAPRRRRRDRVGPPVS